MKKLSSSTTKNNQYVQFFVAVFAMFCVNVAMAAGGGLDTATDKATEVRIWLYGFIGVCAGVYMLYLVGCVFLERKQWSDVLMGLGHVAAAGGTIVACDWAWSIWGS